MGAPTASPASRQRTHRRCQAIGVPCSPTPGPSQDSSHRPGLSGFPAQPARPRRASFQPSSALLSHSRWWAFSAGCEAPTQPQPLRQGTGFGSADPLRRWAAAGWRRWRRRWPAGEPSARAIRCRT